MINPATLNPPKQALLVYALGLPLMLGSVLLKKTGLMETDPLFPWSIATGFLLLFAMFNSIASIQSAGFAKYWGVSIYSYLGLAVALGLTAWLITGIPVGEAQSYKILYIVVTFGFLVFLSMVNMMKKIVNFAEKEEWNQPRKRNR